MDRSGNRVRCCAVDPVIPVRLGIDPYGFIGKYQGLQGNGKTIDVIVDEVVDVVAVSELTASRFIAPAARAFAAAGSFNMARATLATLLKLPVDGWSEDLLALLERASADNDQIAKGVYERQPIPNLLQAIIAERRQRAHA